MNTITKQDILTGYENIRTIIDHLLEKNSIRFISSEIAPSTFEGVKQYYNDFNQFLVYSGGDHGFLGQEYNIKFRALHDHMHVAHNLSFKFNDEKMLSDITMSLFSSVAWNELNMTAWECYVIRTIINAEIKG